MKFIPGAVIGNRAKEYKWNEQKSESIKSPKHGFLKFQQSNGDLRALLSQKTQTDVLFLAGNGGTGTFAGSTGNFSHVSHQDGANKYVTGQTSNNADRSWIGQRALKNTVPYFIQFVKNAT
uniref:Uncharacterized protein n=1 Tax=Ditylenchus dipsaci TaxID=166011 RepID=A0A915DIG1_9BILA